MIAGPTGVGKTELSLLLAEDIFEIISFDSVQIYKYLDIGSGKPDKVQRQKVRHHLIDIVEPDSDFSAGDFVRFAGESLAEIEKSGKESLFVGGTGLYIDSIFGGLSQIPPVENQIREEIIREIEIKGLDFLHGELMKIDRHFGEKVHPNDRQRIIRGLEVFRGTGKPLSSYYAVEDNTTGQDILYVGLYEEREALVERTARRVDRMMEEGFLEEVRSLRERGFGPELKSMRTIGYLELNRYLDGLTGLSEAIESIKIETRRYAKRQMTWFRKNKKINWFHRLETDRIQKLVGDWLKKQKNKYRGM